MSNQRSRSVRVFSGVVFATFAGDPLSKEVSIPSISFTESAPKVTSCPVDEGVTRPAHELASTSSRISEEEEEDEVAVSYVDLRFMITEEDSV